MFRHVPNALTAMRLLLAGVFFVLLGYYQYDGRGSPTLLNIAFLVYVIALLTDFLDGYLARLWKVEGAFGRVVDPFVDKVLVIGAFIFFAGKNFIIPLQSVVPGGSRGHLVVWTITGVTPGMVVLILARELLVTSLRGMSEGSGQNFGAVFAGKLKMGFQSATILVILVYVNFMHTFGKYEPVAHYVRDFGIWATLLITVLSGLLYIQKAMAMYRASESGKTG
jgi:CDP-diacylglycerol--glycerol-3-phosphate 3-phosphatidyltransferase